MFNKNTIVIILLLSISSCGVKTKYLHDIPVEVFKDQTSNMQLTIDLVSYNYRESLLNTEGRISKKDLPDIKKGYFIRSKDDKPFFRLTLNIKNINVLNNKELIIHVFEEQIAELSKKHFEYRDEFSKALLESDKWLSIAGNKEYKKLWKKSGAALKSSVSSSDLAKSLEESFSKFGTILTNKLSFRQYHEDFQNMKGDFVILQYLMSDQDTEKGYENITLKKYGNAWKVVGFSYNLY